MVDHWAIGQRFPIMPVQRLNEAPTRRGILVDLTCDSDGKVRTFVSPEGDKRYLELHLLRPDEPYYLGVFLMGAYQDIMGDMHNLFGRVTEAHVYADEEEPGNFYLEEILPGATVEEQLELVQYHANDLERRMGDLIQKEVKGGRVRPKEGVKLLNEYRRVFRNMTYLNTDPES
jgi:arginine decarboxylase